ncbi:hypothetical protein Lal_00001596 [Lupinus albus]|nr:hypothetical protein Lal_00001596 [Lupinus albus]
MPVPCSCFKANVMLLGQMTKILANTTYDQEKRQRNRKGWFFHCIDRSLTRKRSLYYFEKRIVGLTDELRGKMDLLSLIFSKHFLKFGFGKLAGRGLVRSEKNPYRAVGEGREANVPSDTTAHGQASDLHLPQVPSVSFSSGGRGYTGAKTFSQDIFQTVGVVAPDFLPPNSADPKYSISIIAYGNIESKEEKA